MCKSTSSESEEAEVPNWKLLLLLAFAIRFGKWGNAENFLRKSDRQHSANKWNSQLEKLRQKEAARRRSEDEQYFSGVEKAFGKKAGLAMMAAFDGKSGSELIFLPW